MAEQRPAPPAQIMLRDKGDIVDMYANAGSGQLHPMRGFDPDYTDIVDYIVRLTHRIWEEKAVGLIYETYGHIIPLLTTSGLTKGREAIVMNTLRALEANPRCLIYVDEVVWSGDEDAGFHTSMRYVSVCHNTGHSAYGPPTGRRFVSRGIANCLCKENCIIEEWTVGEALSVVRQLGYDPFAVAAQMARADAAAGVQLPVRENERVVGQLVPQAYPLRASGPFDVEDFLRHLTDEVWNRRRINAVDAFYAQGFLGHMSSAKELHGRGDLKLHILGLLGAFPDAEITVDHVYWNELPGGEYRTAMRWTLSGMHTGQGPYGPPSGKPVRLMGITQHTVRDGNILEEWGFYDELALLKQVAAI